MGQEDKVKLMDMLKDLFNHFDTEDIDCYKLFINALYHNIATLEESDRDINMIIAQILDKAYHHLAIQGDDVYDRELWFLPKNIRDDFIGRKLNDI